MKELDEMIQDAIEMTLPKASTEKKQKYHELLRQALETGQMPSAKDFGITTELEEQFYDLAYQQFKSGNYSDASAILAWLCVIDEKDFRYPFGLACCYHMQKDYENAIGAYNQAFFRDSDNPLPFYHASDCFLKLNYPGMAILCLNMVLSQTDGIPTFAKLHKRTKLAYDSLVKEAEEKQKKKGE